MFDLSLPVRCLFHMAVYVCGRKRANVWGFSFYSRTISQEMGHEMGLEMGQEMGFVHLGVVVLVIKMQKFRLSVRKFSY